jgi:hypothetical protein
MVDFRVCGTRVFKVKAEHSESALMRVKPVERMMRRISIVVMLLTSAACSTDLDRSTVMSVMREHSIGTSIAWLPNPNALSRSDPRFQTYLSLDGRLIICGDRRCEPMPGTNISTLSDSQWNFVVGEWMVSSVTGVTKTGESTAEADVAVTLRRGKPYTEYPAQLDQLAMWVIDYKRTGEWDARGFPRLGPETTADRSARLAFRRFDDGWRVESVVR